MGLSLEQFALLNVIWAATIVLMEVPSGAFADTFGRKRLLVMASGCMVVEMLILCFVPLGDATVVFYALAVNRVISGVAEALASGADEALAYDSLKSASLEGQWGHVLERLMVLKSIAFCGAMLLGAAVYDAAFLNGVLQALGTGWQLQADTTLRFPLYLNLATALLVFGITLGLKEIDTTDETHAVRASLRQACGLTWQTGLWILSKPVVWALIVIALSFDSIIRLFLTLNSEYYRLIHIPEAALGVMGAAIGIMGLCIPRVARMWAERHSVRTNFAWVGVLVLMGLWGLSLAIPWWGIVPALVIGAAMYLLNFFLSYYLNQAVDSKRRATVLSFRGLACNLSYGLLGLLYMGLTHFLRTGFTDTAVEAEQAVFSATLDWLPGYFIALLFVLFIGVWRPLKKLV